MWTFALLGLLSADLSLSSVAWVRAEAEGEGAAWVIDGPGRLLVTAAHVVGDRKTVDVIFPVGDADRDSVLGRRESLRASGHWLDGTVVRTDAGSDLALVRVPSLPTDAVPLTLSRARPGDAVRLVGHRGDSPALWNLSAGVVRGRLPAGGGTFAGGRRWGDRVAPLFLQLPTAVGDSGGPVLDARGGAVGVLTATHRRVADGALATGAGDVGAFLGRAFVSAQFGPPAMPPFVPLALPPPPPPPLMFEWSVVRIDPDSTERRDAGILLRDQSARVLTTLAAVGDAKAVTVLLPKARPDGGLACEWDEYRDRFALAQENRRVRALVRVRDERTGLALLELGPEVNRGSDFDWYKLTREPVRLGEEVRAVGHALGAPAGWLYSSGVVRQRLADGTVVVQLPAEARASGAPVVAGRRLVGILSAREGGQGQLGYAVPIAAFHEFVQVDLKRGLEKDPAARLRHALAWRAAGREALARSLLRELIADHPAFPDARAALEDKPQPGTPRARAEAQAAAGDWADAAATLALALEAEPGRVDLLCRRAEFLSRAGEWKRAVAEAQAARSIDPVARAPLDLLARLAVERNDPELLADVERDRKRLPAP